MARLGTHRLTAFLLASLVSPATVWGQQTEAQEIALAEKEPIAFLLATPTGQIASIRSSDIIRMVTDELRRNTNLAPELVEAGLFSSCKARFGCLVEGVRQDYNYESLILPNGEKESYNQHLRALARDGVRYPRYVLVMSNITTEGEADRLFTVLIDTDAALGILHEADRSKEDWRDDAETKISETAVKFGPERREIRTEEDARAFIFDLFGRDLEPVFEATVNWKPYGEILIHTQGGGHTIVLDGMIVGTTNSDLTRLTHVTRGVRELELQHPKYQPFKQSVEVVRGKTAEVTVEAPLAEGTSASVSRSLLFWGGVGVAAIGTGVLALTLARQDGDVRNYCWVGGSVECESSSSLQRSGYDPELASNLDPGVNASGVLMAPLGYSLMIAGGTWLGGVLLDPDGEDFPWIPLVAGIGLGAAAYGVSAALDSPTVTGAE